MTTPGASNDQIRSLATVLGKPDSTTPVTLTKAVVGAVNLTASPPSIDIQIGGDTSVTVSAVRFIDSYSPVAGDTCLIVKQGADVFALGHLDDTNEGTSANGWQTPTLNSGYATNGNSNGAFLFRVILDNGDRKVQLKGSVALSGSPGTAIATLPVGYRPSAKRSLLVARDPGGGSNVEQVDIQTDGQIVRVGSTIAPAAAGSGSTSTVTGAVTGSFDIQHYHIDAGTNTSGIISSGGVGGATDGGNNPHTHSVPDHSHTIGSHTHTVSAPTWIGFNGAEYYL